MGTLIETTIINERLSLEIWRFVDETNALKYYGRVLFSQTHEVTKTYPKVCDAHAECTLRSIEKLKLPAFFDKGGWLYD